MSELIASHFQLLRVVVFFLGNTLSLTPIPCACMAALYAVFVDSYFGLFVSEKSAELTLKMLCLQSK